MNVVHNFKSGGWARRRAIRERDILDAAMELFVDAGPDLFTLKLLAEKTSSAVGAVYRYYPSKEALLVALQRRVLTELSEELRDVTRRIEDPLSRLVAAARWYAALPERRPREFHLLSAAIGDPRELVQREAALSVLEAATPLFQTMEELIAAATAEGQLQPGRARTRGVELWAALHGVLQIQKLARVVPSLDGRALAPQLVRDLLRGWGATRETLARASRARVRRSS